MECQGNFQLSSIGPSKIGLSVLSLMQQWRHTADLFVFTMLGQRPAQTRLHSLPRLLIVTTGLFFPVEKNSLDWPLSSDSPLLGEFYLDSIMLNANECLWAPAALQSSSNQQIFSRKDYASCQQAPAANAGTLPVSIALYMRIKMFSFLPVLKGQPSRLSQWVFTDLVTYFVMCVDKWIKIQGPW